MLHPRTSPTGIVYYTSPLLEQIGVPHAFSTRIGGVSKPPFDSLNLGNPSTSDLKDDWANIYENCARLQAAIDCAGRERCWVHQVHGGEAVCCDDSFESGRKADAMVTTDPRRLLSVRVADCVPVLLASDNGTAVSAIHAGWRGVLAGAVINALEMMSFPSSAVIAAIGPCIGFEAFEVGVEVLDAFAQSFGRNAPLQRASQTRGRVDLRRAIATQLQRCGVSRIDTTDRCTFTDREEFFSHRRDRGVTGRMAAMIGPIARTVVSPS